MTLSSTSFQQAEIKVDRGTSKQLGMILKILGRGKTLKKKKFTKTFRTPLQKFRRCHPVLYSGSTLCSHAPSLPSHLTPPSLSHLTTSFEHGVETHFSIFIWHGPKGPLLPLHKVTLRGRELPLLGYLVICHLRRPPQRPRRFPLLRVERPLVPHLLLLSIEFSAMPSCKRARTSDLGESSKASQPEPPVATHARAPTDSKLPFDMLPGSIIRSPMLTALPIEGNSDSRLRPFHSEFYFDQEAF
ncbi:hypothetical protein CK203_043298 [Vitis vinifera]|uniref:Uncharacterized protein n=1 Tax=Vitis vinifera TaxID=29760 RepID=A0A438GYI4_VITVI|nr:hypothetical protein CK203_043298 [Vitis vinifera]